MIFQTLLQNGLTARLIAASLDLCLMAGFIGLVILVFRIQAPRLKAMLWLLVLAKPLLVLAVGSPLPFFRINAAIADPVRHNRDFTAGSTLDSLLEEQLEKDRHRATSAGAQSAEGAWTARVSAGDEKAASPVPLVAGPVSWDRIIAGVWLSGVVLFLGLILHGHYRIHRIFMRSGTPGDKLLKGFIETAGEMGIRDIPTLRLSDEVDSPALAGFVRPVIFLPSWLGENVEPSRIMWILRHELMHWKMKDPLALLFRRIAEALFFFHPAVWMVGKKWEESMELACDRALLRKDPDARHYAEQLYSLLENRNSRGKTALAGGLFATRTQIGNRIAALLANPFRHPARLGVYSMIFLMTLALIGLSTGLGISQTQISSGEQDIPQLVQKTQVDLKAFATAAYAYLVDHNQVPADMKGLTTPVAYITHILPDPFAPGEPIRMSLSGDSREVVYYSVGPDGIDQKGAIPYDPANGVQSAGDILVRVSQTRFDAQTRQSSIPAPQDKDPLMNALLKLKEEEGRDNAHIYYSRAGMLLPPFNARESKDLDQVLSNGWKADCDVLRPILEEFLPAFAEVRKGEALDYASNVTYQGVSTPVPNFLSAQRIAKMLCAEGRFLESHQKHDFALRDYFTVLTMGRDYGAKNAALIGVLISIAVENVALRQIYRLVTSGAITDVRVLSEFALPRLKTIEDTTPSAADAFRQETLCVQTSFQHYREHPEEFMKIKPADMKIEGPLDQVLEQWGRSVAQYWAIQMAYLEKPYAERDQADFLRKLDQWKASTPQHLKPLIDTMLPNTQEADVRIHVTKSRLRQTRIATALEIFRLEKGGYPAQLSELVPRHFSELPADVFSGQSYIYQPTADRRAYLLYGVGPDRADDKGAIYYDPTNGTLSAGDLLFQ